MIAVFISIQSSSGLVLCGYLNYALHVVRRSVIRLRVLPFKVCRMSLANEHLAAEKARALDYASLIGQKKCFCMLGQIDRLEQVCFYGDRSLETNPQSLSTIQ